VGGNCLDNSTQLLKETKIIDKMYKTAGTSLVYRYIAATFKNKQTKTGMVSGG
jgi:hypothetical protein